MKALSLTVQKIWPMLKFLQTDRQTDRRTGQKLQLIDTYPENIDPKVTWEFENVGFDEKKSLDIQVFITPAAPAEMTMLHKNIFLSQVPASK